MKLGEFARRIVPVIALAAAAFAVVPAGPAQADGYGYWVRATNKDGRAEEFGTGIVDDVWHQWATTPGGPINSAEAMLAGQKISSGIGVSHNKDGRLEIFGRGQNGALWHNWQVTAGGDWSGWYELSGLIQPHSYLSASYQSSTGTIWVQVVGVDGYLHTLRQLQPNCCWNSRWE
jgi:hypothetical protein